MIYEKELLDLMVLYYSNNLDSSRYMRLVALLLINAELVEGEIKKLYIDMDKEIK